MTTGAKVPRRVLILGVLAVLAVGGVAATAYSRAADDERDLEAARRHAAIEEHYAQLQEQGNATMAPVPEDPENAGPSTQPAEAWGDSLTTQPEFPGSPQWTFTTGLTTSDADHNVGVYAGALTESPESGIVVVVDQVRAFYDTSTDVLTPAGSTGPLTVVSGDASTVELVDAAGTRFTLDVESRTFE